MNRRCAVMCHLPHDLFPDVAGTVMCKGDPCYAAGDARDSLSTCCVDKTIMGRSYSAETIRQKLISVLNESETGMMSGVAIAERIGISRTTMTKYLNVFAAEGRLLRRRDVGNVTLWSLEPGQESYDFPDDYFKIASAYLERLTQGTDGQVLSLVDNCLHSGADARRLITEVILPAITTVRTLYNDSKIGTAEQSLFCTTISRSIDALGHMPQNDPRLDRNVVVIAADSHSALASEAASAIYRLEGWRVHHLGDMSHSINVLFDLDLQKLMGRVWKRRPGIMIMAVFSDTFEGLQFFADAINTVKTKSNRRIKLVLCGHVPDQSVGDQIRSDLLTQRVEDILQWSRTISGNIK